MIPKASVTQKELPRLLKQGEEPALEFKRSPAIAGASVFWSTLLSLLTVSTVIAMVR